MIAMVIMMMMKTYATIKCPKLVTLIRFMKEAGDSEGDDAYI